MRANLVGLLLLLGAAAAAGQPEGGYQKTIAEWRAQQEAQLKADDGWLTVVGLHWLKEGESGVGSNTSFEVPLPKAAPDRVGTILAVGRVKFFVIKREDRFGVRMKDNNSAARREFTGLRWYPVDPAWRVQA